VVQLRYPYPRSSTGADSPRRGGDPVEERENPGEFDEWLDQELGPIRRTNSSQSLTDMSLSVLVQSTSGIRSSFFSLTGWDTEASAAVQPQRSDRIVCGKTIRFHDLRAVRARLPETGSSITPALLLQSRGVQYILPFSSATLGDGIDVKQVLKHLAKAMCSAIAHPGRKAHWDFLHKTLHQEEEARWHQDDRNRSYDRDASNPADSHSFSDDQHGFHGFV